MHFVVDVVVEYHVFIQEAFCFIYLSMSTYESTTTFTPISIP